MLPPGTEVDYNVAHELWVPARVEAPTDGGGVRLRFSVGGTTEVTQALSAEEVARRIAPAGTQTLPFLDGQPVDVLRRTRASSSYPPQEQWQRGEVCGYSHLSGSVGASCDVRVRIMSTGDAVLGTSYAREDVADTASPINVNTSHLCLQGAFSKWVPTIADVQRLSLASSSPGLTSLVLRSRVCFRDAARVSNLLDSGRVFVQSHDQIDVLPPLCGSTSTNDLLNEKLLCHVEDNDGSVITKQQCVCGAYAEFPLARSWGAVALGLPRKDAFSAAESTTAEIKQRLLAHSIARQWHPARVQLLSLRAAGNVCRQLHSKEGSVTAEFSSASTIRTPNDDLIPFAFWYEPYFSGDCFSRILRVAPLSELDAVAPLGCYTWPLVPDMRIDYRPLGGAWAPAIVISADRFFLRLRPLELPESGLPSLLTDANSARSAFLDRTANSLRVHMDNDSVDVTKSHSTGEVLRAVCKAHECDQNTPQRSVVAVDLDSVNAEKGCITVPAQLWRHVIARAGTRSTP